MRYIITAILLFTIHVGETELKKVYSGEQRGVWGGIANYAYWSRYVSGCGNAALEPRGWIANYA